MRRAGLLGCVLASLAVASCGGSGDDGTGGSSATGAGGGATGAGGTGAGGSSAGAGGSVTGTGGMGSPAGTGGGSAGGGDLSGGGAGGMGACAGDPLHTGLVAQQTGVSVDSFDCQIQSWAAHYAEPDPMIFKAIIYVESRFDQTSVACPNLPCGMPTGWTNAESRCYGLMQVVASCGPLPDGAGSLPDGHPNLTTDPASPDWSGSIFNPDQNIHIGIAGVAGNRAQVMKKFPGCTTEQYTLMAIGDYNSYGSTKSCTEYNTAYDDGVLMAYGMYADAAGYPKRPY